MPENWETFAKSLTRFSGLDMNFLDPISMTKEELLSDEYITWLSGQVYDLESIREETRKYSRQDFIKAALEDSERIRTLNHLGRSYYWLTKEPEPEPKSDILDRVADAVHSASQTETIDNICPECGEKMEWDWVPPNPKWQCKCGYIRPTPNIVIDLKKETATAVMGNWKRNIPI